ncbi:hypothetical protein C8R44DRAFT_776424 [Mycena epipterygia]|nr:hypothetical protein C8R44DRAFT_776424 [Mycena epipterygia]
MSRPATERAQAQRDARYETYLEYTTALPLLPFPSLEIHLEPNDGARIRVDGDPAYAGIRALARTVLTHLVGSPVAYAKLLAIMVAISPGPAAKKALASRLGHNGPITAADITDYLRDHTPAIVLKDLRGEQNEVLWGQVLQGTEEGADRNEVFILLELAATLRDPAPPNTLQIAVQQQYHRLILSIALLHGLVHAITKYFFSPTFITPLLPSMLPDDTGNGAPGRTFEKAYLGFHLETAWTRPDFESTDRMWHIDGVLASRMESSFKLLVIDQHTVQRILRSLTRSGVWTPVADELLVYVYGNESRVRYRVGYPSRPVEDEDEDDSDNVDLSGMVTATMCSRGARRIGPL